MKQRLGYVLVLALASGSVGVSACTGDDTTGDEDTGGSAGAAGSHAGNKTGGTSSSGSSNKAGSNNGGEAGKGSGGTPDEGGAAGTGGVPGGGAADGGVGGVGDGGTPGNMAGASGEAGAGGSGGAGEPQLVYACGSDNAYKKVCSAKAAANCDNAIVCAECVPQTKDEHDGAATGCQTCDDLIDEYYQCGIDAFEMGNTAAGMQCVGPDADFSDQCFDFFSQYFACDTYLGDHDCPATWPAE
jgi:hypothetical protein